MHIRVSYHTTAKPFVDFIISDWKIKVNTFIRKDFLCYYPRGYTKKKTTNRS